MRRITAIAVAGVVLALLVVAQLVLPWIAADRLRDRLSRSGSVLEVKVSAFPAIKLLWHHADSVQIRVGSYRSDPARIGGLVGEAADVGSIDASATVLDSGLLTVHDATLHKRGDQLTGRATVDEADLQRAFPILQSVQPIASGKGQLILRGTATLLGVTATVDATVAAQNGRLIVQPGVPFGALATVTVFSNPHVYVEAVAASPGARGFTVSVRGRVT
jgi:LmeA-like phospholipid-binding